MSAHGFHVRSWNFGPGSLADLLRLLEDCEALAGQEFGDQKRAVRQARKIRRRQKRPIGVAWSPGSNPGRKTPILYDKTKWRRVRWHQILAVPGGIFLGRAGAGPDRTEPKYVNRVRLKSRVNGGVLVVVNTHLTPSAWSTHGPEAEARRKVWMQQVTRFFRIVKRTRVPVIGMADWNAEADRIPVPGGWSWVRTPPTHGRSTIDLIGYEFHPQLDAAKHGDVTDTTSDHRSPRGRFVLTRKERG